MEGNVYLPARVTAETVDESTLDKINRLTLEPLKQDEVFTFSGSVSNDRMDSYFTRMDPATTLRNYVDDLKRGVSLMDWHETWRDPYGRSFDGEIESTLIDGVTNETSARGHFYIVRDMKLNQENTDDKIKAIRSGVIRDMSVGFGGDDMKYRCSSCSRHLDDWECPHIPGYEDEYSRMVFAWIENATLREVSTVYKGATPGAYIDKAREYIQQGQLNPKAIQQLERAYGTKLDNNKRLYLPGKPQKEETEAMNIEEIRSAMKEGKLDKREIASLLNEGDKPYRNQEDVALINELGANASLETVRQMKKEAEHGRSYFADLVEQAVKSRVRAQGDKFNADRYRAMLVRTDDVEYVKEEIEAYEDDVNAQFQGGRQTEDTPPTDDQQQNQDDIIESSDKPLFE